MRSVIAGFVLGTICLQQQANLFDISVLLPGLLLAALCLLCGHRIVRTGLRGMWNLAAGFACGFLWASLFAQYYLAQELAPEYEGRDLSVVGVVADLPVSFPQGRRFHLNVEKVLDESGRALQLGIPDKIALSWYGAYGESGHNVPLILPGQRWQLMVRLKRPHGTANPHVFDYEVWLLEQNLRATGTVKTDQQAILFNRQLDEFAWSLHGLMQRARARLQENIYQALPGMPYASVLVALVIGQQSEIAQADWKIFNRSGISHLIAISGMHITMLAGLMAGLIHFLWRHSFFTDWQLPLRLPAQKAAALAGLLTAWIYVALAGFAVPAQRTLYMLLVVAVAMYFGRLHSITHVLGLALFLVLFFDPWAVLWPGFWLSFAAVAIILYASGGQRPRKTKQAVGWRQHLHLAGYTQYAVSLGLLPLTMLLFGQISLISPLANALAIPLISFVVTPLAMLGSVLPVSLGAQLLAWAHACLSVLFQILHYLCNLPMAVWVAPIPAFWMFVCAMLGSLWCLAPRGWPWRSLGLICWLPILLQQNESPASGDCMVTGFDVGQGMALLIETRHHRLLYDTGPYYAPESDGANRVILPYLAARGIRRLDGVIVTHQDADHSGGALSLLAEIPTDWVTSSLPQHHPVVSAATRHLPCVAGQSWNWDGVQFDMLHPDAGSYALTKLKPNARSCVLKITRGAHSMLLAGDIEAAQEQSLVQKDAEKLRANILLAPHHGSGTSSTLNFLRAVRADLAIFQVGYRNRYHHPKPEVFARYAELGIKRLRTDDSGAIKVHMADQLYVSEYRKDHQRYWYGR